MIGIRFIDEVTPALNNVRQSITPEGSKMLDAAAQETLVKMSQEAPYASGRLQSSIKIEPRNLFNEFSREIYPSEEYGFYQETRHKMTQKRPPLEKIRAWAEIRGFDNKAAFLIARKIAQSGYPSNPFVLRTYRWVQVQIVRHAGNFLNIIGAKYMAGGRTKTFKV